jgi:hypothetical protein
VTGYRRAMSVTGDETQVRAVPWWRTLGALLSGVLGAVALVGGLTWLLLNLHGPRIATDVLVGVVLAVGGLVLLMPHRIPLRPARTAAVAITTAVVGTLVGLMVSVAQLAGMWAYVMARGYPFRWAGRGAQADDPAVARRLAEAADWQIDVVALAGDLLFWGFAGLLAVVAVDLVRQVRRRAA